MASLHHKNLKQWKTTVVGILMIAASIGYLFYVDAHDKIIFFGILAIGIVLLFLPDALFSGLRKLIAKNSDKEL